MSSEENLPGGGSYAHSEKGIPSILFKVKSKNFLQN